MEKVIKNHNSQLANRRVLRICYGVKTFVIWSTRGERIRLIKIIEYGQVVQQLKGLDEEVWSLIDGTRSISQIHKRLSLISRWRKIPLVSVRRVLRKFQVSNLVVISDPAAKCKRRRRLL
jgi:hypothetical protein